MINGERPDSELDGEQHLSDKKKKRWLASKLLLPLFNNALIIGKENIAIVKYEAFNNQLDF